MPDEGYMDAAAVPVPDAEDDLTGRAIIAAHDASCPGRCSEDVSTYRALTTREQAIVAQWQADVETTSVVHECCEARQTAEAAIERARAVHREHTNTALVEHCKCLACDMARALDGTETTDAD